MEDEIDLGKHVCQPTHDRSESLCTVTLSQNSLTYSSGFSYYHIMDKDRLPERGCHHTLPKYCFFVMFPSNTHTPFSDDGRC